MVEFRLALVQPGVLRFRHQPVIADRVQHVVAEAAGPKLVQPVVAEVHLRFQRVGVADRRHLAEVDDLT